MNNTFGLDLWRRMPTGNFVMSPASVAPTMVMVWTGARERTAKQLAKALDIDGSLDDVARTFGEEQQTLRTTPGVTLAIANRLFGERTCTFEQAFQDRLANTMGAPMEALDFINAPGPACGHVNKWVAEQTKGKISNLLPPPAITTNTRLLLVNAVYFLGKWLRPFFPTETMLKPFWTSADQSKPVQTMHQTAAHDVATCDGGVVVQLPYEGSAIAMQIVVPDDRAGLARVENKLDPSKWRFGSERITLALPKFTVSPDTLRLNAALIEMGIEDAFSPRKANFSGMSSPGNYADELYLSDVFHKAFVQTDEQGTVAAAATAASMVPRGGRPQPPRMITVDRPFLFLLTDVRTNTILFIGRVIDPSVS